MSNVKFRKGDIVSRIADLEGVFKKGERAVVDYMLDSSRLRLEGNPYPFLASEFSFVATVDDCKMNANVSLGGLETKAKEATLPEQLELGLGLIAKWNSMKPTASVVTIHGEIPQDGGNVYELGNGFTTSNMYDLIAELMKHASDEEVAVAYQRVSSTLLARSNSKR